MCGLFGVVSSRTLTTKGLEAFIDLGFVSSLRGKDSTGVMALERGKKGRFDNRILKEAANSVTFFSSGTTKNFLNHNRNKTVCLLGHTRTATMGKVTSLNAHPYRVNNIVGFHNGTCNKFKPTSEEKTDSRMMFESIAGVGLDETIHSLWSNDAYCIVLYNEKDNTVQFVRNDKRPLVFGTSKDGETFYASEKQFIEIACGRNDIEITDYLVMPTELVYTFDVDAGEWENRPLEKKPFVPYVWKGPPKAQDIVTTKIVPLIPVRKEELTTKSIDAILPLKSYRGPNKVWMDPEEGQKVLNKGCDMCERVARSTEIVKFNKHSDNYICATCKKDPALAMFCAGPLSEYPDESDYSVVAKMH